MSFASLVANWKQSFEEEALDSSSDTTASSTAFKSSANVVVAPTEQLVNVKNLGGEAAIPEGRSHDVVENSGYTRESDKAGVRCAAERDENEAPASPGVGLVPRPKKHGAVRGNGRAPKRAPIPRWDADSELQPDVIFRYKLI